TSIRTHGASGKHLAEGERSMLALFKESAMKIMEDNEGTIVSFNMFYDALEQFLDHSHKNVITRAIDNELINPEKTNECFAVDVLKTLFMIKYVKEIVANLENITSLMVSNIDDDRIALKDKVEEALKKPALNLDDPAFLRQALLGYTEKVIELEHKVQALEPKAKGLDR
ncbi:MAG: hypothetical protein RSE07_07125, partial [Oscillospiraceae bacterium]